MDELLTLVGRRKKGKYLLVYAYSPKYDVNIGFESGSAKTMEGLMVKLRGLEVG
ncbi:hypothetical protein ACFS7Z_08085 [Pontibacter toksunensis]|uniref:Uncharacterized protein n=1 Tax=Pontibacter toksunensis TaxID=1332631 RepID=A0ABW6BR66_9BACT